MTTAQPKLLADGRVAYPQDGGLCCLKPEVIEALQPHDCAQRCGCGAAAGGWRLVAFRVPGRSVTRRVAVQVCGRCGRLPRGGPLEMVRPPVRAGAGCGCCEMETDYGPNSRAIAGARKAICAILGRRS